MKLKKILFLTAALSFILVSCKKDDYASDTFFAMDTFITISAQDADENLLKNAAKETEKYEQIFSRKDKDSQLYALNASNSSAVSDELLYMIKNAFEISENTNYAFNPCLGAISDLWDVTGAKHVATDEEIAEILPFCSPGEVKIDGNAVSKSDSKTVIDFGACAKGYTAQKIIEYLKENGAKNACVNFGGNVSVCGNSNEKENGWKVGVKNPFLTDDIIGYIVCTDKTVSVSGDYERFFESEGKIYHHIFDSATGKPADSGIKSIAVISSDGFISDALSTALFVMGVEKSLDFYSRRQYDFEAVIITCDGKVFTTDGIKEDFFFFDDAYFDGASYLKFEQ
jgi:thiamine biosynthesis lipoprotein